MSDIEAAPIAPQANPGDEKLEAEVAMVLRFACREGRATPEILDAAAKLDGLKESGQELARQDVARRLLNDLAVCIRPATIEGVRIVRDMLKVWDGTFKGWLLSFLPNRVFAEFFVYGFIAFLALMYYQVFTGSASFAVSVYEKSLSKYDDVLSNISQLKMAEGDKFDEAKYEDLFRRKDFLAGRLVSTAKTIEAVSALEPWPFSQRNYENQQIQAEEIRSNNAHTRLNHSVEMISKYILPILYGLLGACTFVIRLLMVQLDAAAFERASLYRFRFRLLLGAVLGGIVSLFVSPDTMTGLNLSLGAGAFLAGYGVEVFFSIFDKTVDKLKETITGEGRNGQPAALPQPAVPAPEDEPAKPAV